MAILLIHSRRTALLILLCSALAIGDASRQLSFEPLATYEPFSDVSDSANIDLDIESMKLYLAVMTPTGFQNAATIYTQGGNARSYAEVSLVVPISLDLPAATEVAGVSKEGNGGLIGKLLEGVSRGATTIKFQYPAEMCRLDSTPFNSDDLSQRTPGCLIESGNLNLEMRGVSLEYTYDGSAKNAITLEGFSLMANSQMLQCPACPYPEFSKFYNYFGTSMYADNWIQAAFRGAPTDFSNGNADFSRIDSSGRSEAIQDAAVAMTMWMTVIAKMEASIDSCRSGSSTETSVLQWDTAVAYYVGSVVGPDGSGFGQLLHTLANKRCLNFRTCGENGTLLFGEAFVNNEVMRLFKVGQRIILDGDCSSLEETKTYIVRYMTVPLIQSALRYAYISSEFSDQSDKLRVLGERATYFASILPIVHDCSMDDADIIYEETNINAVEATDFSTVKAALERNYNCIGVTCEQIGGVFDASQGKYFEGAEPCRDGGAPGTPITPPISSQPGAPSFASPSPAPTITIEIQIPLDSLCFSGEATVQIKGRGPTPMKDLAVGDHILVEDEKYEAVYAFGHRDESKQASDMLRLSPWGLELSMTHMLWVESRGFIPASMLRVEDVLSDGRKVEIIETVRRVGVYAPFTRSGVLSVNGVLCSNYISWQGTSHLDTGITAFPFNFHWISHLFTSLYRIWCSELVGGSGSVLADDGFSLWSRTMRRFGSWFFTQPFVLQNAIVSVLLPILLLSRGVEVVLDNFASLLLCFGALRLVILNTLQERKKSKKEAFN